MPVYDVSLPLSDATPVYPGDEPFRHGFVRRMAEGSRSNNSRFSAGCHSGTHVDAPLHFIDGAGTVDAIAPEALVGPCRLVDVGDARAIDRGVLEPLGLEGVERVLIRTTNSAWIARRFEPDFVAFTPDGAEYLAGLGPRIVGIDAPSVDPYGAKVFAAHTALLERVDGLIEWLSLAGLEPGAYELFCGPLRIVGAEGAPCRVLLRR